MSERDEFLVGGMGPVTCDCWNRVLVLKNSPRHTSVQWLSDTRDCPELCGPGSAFVPTCLRLRDSIEKAVRDGTLEVADG
jgi:hypothetical protein